MSVAFTFGYTLHLGEIWGPPHKKQTIPGPENCSCLLFAILSLVMGLVCFPCLFSLKWIFLTWFFCFWPLLLLLSCLFLDATFSNSLKVCSLVGLSFVEDLPLFFCFFFTLNAWHSLASVQVSILFKLTSDFSSLSNVVYIWKSSGGEYLLPVASSLCLMFSLNFLLLFLMNCSLMFSNMNCSLALTSRLKLASLEISVILVKNSIDPSPLFLFTFLLLAKISSKSMSKKRVLVISKILSKGRAVRSPLVPEKERI